MSEENIELTHWRETLWGGRVVCAGYILSVLFDKHG